MKLFLDWSSYENAGMGDAYADIPKSGGDFAKAVAVCINSRQCEQTGKGVMCPSYRVTGNPLLTPGGRVKLLKAALNAGQEDALTNPELAAAMNLCVSCKGCKRECENEVDMALIKAEYLAQRRKAQGLSLRHKLWAHLPLLLEWRVTARLVAYRNRLPWLAKLGEKWLGIAASARLPQPVRLAGSAEHKEAHRSQLTRLLTSAHRIFTAQPAQPVGCAEHNAAHRSRPMNLPAAQPSQSEEVVLFIDTFNRHFQPQVAAAATALLTAAGYNVHQLGLPEDRLCCGRTYFNNGMLAQARQQARQLLTAVQPHLAAGRWIVGLEPSCILSLRDEYLKLELGEAAVKLAERVLLLEEFIAREQTAKRWQLNFKATGQPLLVHGHCHQKAVGAMKAMRKVLKSVDGLEFELIESSCCGMAGHFGLEAEHYPTSQAMAELALYPALRQQPEAGLVTNGFSCRLQIENGGFQQPQHLAELLYAASLNRMEVVN